MMTQKHVSIATADYLDEQTLEPGRGGLQRWCHDVSLLFRDHGYAVTIYQKTVGTIKKTMGNGVLVIGVTAPARFWGNFFFARKFARLVDDAEPILFVSQELLLGKFSDKTLSVNHGLWWDGDFPFWKIAIVKWIQRHTLKRTRAVICVDSNYVNWCHAEIAGRLRWRGKLLYVPNYADELAFKYYESEPQDGTRPLRILCPRRLEDNSIDNWDGRGVGFLLHALVALNQQGLNFVAEFAGKGATRDSVLAFARHHGIVDRVKCTEYALDEMPIAYANADVVVIPTAAHEGTSLAAVEAMCCGKPTVVTHIGGLPNLVIDGLNGFIADLSIKSLCEKILEAATYCNNEPWKKATSLLAIRHFGKRRWETQMWKHLSNILFV
jgi:glycosyltransferase involved in cell wall biosynthesis